VDQFSGSGQRDIGLCGFTAHGLPENGWRGRNDGRNTAFADLLFESGLRLREGGCLLTLEVPHAIHGYAYYEGTVAAAIAKRSERIFYLNADALSGIETYLATARRAAIRQARRAGRYDRLRGKQIVTDISQGRQRRVFWQDALGNKADAPINAIDAGERQRLFIEADGGLEPLQLWLTEGGMPMSYPSWEKVFSAANDRCERFGKPIYLTPHACRHSFALKMLVTLDRALDRRFGLDRSERDHARKVYGDAFALVKDLLGHSSEETTRTIYLAPLNGLRLRSILDGNQGEDLDAILTRVAHSSRLVMDVNPTAEDA
jgi:integrase